MSKKYISLHKDIKIVELDTNKHYVITFPEYTESQDFIKAVESIKKIGWVGLMDYSAIDK